jgi:hypothetical protein
MCRFTLLLYSGIVLLLGQIATMSFANPVETFQNSSPKVLYVWMSKERFLSRKEYAKTHRGQFMPGRNQAVFAWHTPLGAIGYKAPNADQMYEYGEVLVKLHIRDGVEVQQIAYRDYVVPENQILFYRQTHTCLQFQEWILNETAIDSWEAFTSDILDDVKAELINYENDKVSLDDRHVINNEYFDRISVVESAKKRIRDFKNASAFSSKDLNVPNCHVILLSR